MPTIISFLLAPICVVLAVYRLITIPWQMYRGQRRLSTQPLAWPAVWAALAYGALLAYLLWLGSRVYLGLTLPGVDAREVLRLVLYFEAFPLVYVLAESRFFYGFERKGKNAMPRQAGVSGAAASFRP